MESLNRSALLALPLAAACTQEITEPDVCLDAAQEFSEHIGFALTRAPQLINHESETGCVFVYLHNRSEHDDLNFIYDYKGELNFMEQHDTGAGNILLMACDVDTASIKNSEPFDVYATDGSCETTHSFGSCIDQEECLTKYSQTWEAVLPVQDTIRWDME